MSQESPANRPFRIGTRRSKLAVVQAEGIRDALQKLAPHRTFEIEALRTLGDKDKSTALYSFGAKNLWTTELEEKLTSREIDVVVHCLKGEYSPATPPVCLFQPELIADRQTCQPGSRTPATSPLSPSVMTRAMPSS
jgi:hydroxymethylbilane synthase